LGTILSMLSDSDSYVQPQARLSDRQQAPISERISFPIQVPPRSKRNNGQQWRDALQSCATACCRVQPRDTVCSHASAWWIMLAPCTHMKASEKNLSPRRVRAHCVNCERCDCSRSLLCTLAYVGCLLLARSLPSSLSLFLSLSLALTLLRVVVGLRAYCRCAPALC